MHALPATVDLKEHRANTQTYKRYNRLEAAQIRFNENSLCDFSSVICSAIAINRLLILYFHWNLIFVRCASTIIEGYGRAAFIRKPMCRHFSFALWPIGGDRFKIICRSNRTYNRRSLWSVSIQSAVHRSMRCTNTLPYPVVRFAIFPTNRRPIRSLQMKKRTNEMNALTSTMYRPSKWRCRSKCAPNCRHVPFVGDRNTQKTKRTRPETFASTQKKIKIN